MTQDDLERILEGKDLLNTIDIRTLILDILKNSPEDKISELFYSTLPDIDEDYLKRFFYMTRA